MSRLVMAHPVARGRGADHLEWCQEIRARRDEIEVSRLRVGITRQLVWTDPARDMAVVRIDADDPVASLEALSRSNDPFDRWYADRECDVHGGTLLDDGVVPEVLADYRHGEPDELDMFIASAVVLRPGKTEVFRRAVEASVTSGSGESMLRMWDIRQLTIWLHPTSLGDAVIYEAIGDLAEMMRSLAESDDPVVAPQRDSFRDRFGIDLTREPWPMPRPGWSWSAPSA